MAMAAPPRHDPLLQWLFRKAQSVSVIATLPVALTTPVVTKPAKATPGKEPATPAEEKGLELSFENAPLEVYADRNRIRQVLTNLIDNAIAYTDEGSVRCRMRRHMDKARVEVVDTGRGIGQDLLARVEAEVRAADGTGIWLDTYSFQAPGFYRKMGFEEFGSLDDTPDGQSRHFFRKRLT